jgi:hypothetical protein
MEPVGHRGQSQRRAGAGAGSESETWEPEPMWEVPNFHTQLDPREVDPGGFEPPTSWLPAMRSTS